MNSDRLNFNFDQCDNFTVWLWRRNLSRMRNIIMGVRCREVAIAPRAKLRTRWPLNG